jgi:hypothetical protein
MPYGMVGRGGRESLKARQNASRFKSKLFSSLFYFSPLCVEENFILYLS